jgi:DNA-binding NarL/FixJ family response regulator
MERRSQTDPNNPENQARNPLTGMQLEILDLMSRGLTCVEIASELDRAEQNIKNHRANIYRRLNVNNPAHAIRRGFELGLLKPDPQENKSGVLQVGVLNELS